MARARFLRSLLFMVLSWCAGCRCAPDAPVSYEQTIALTGEIEKVCHECAALFPDAPPLIMCELDEASRMLLTQQELAYLAQYDSGMPFTAPFLLNLCTRLKHKQTIEAVTLQVTRVPLGVTLQLHLQACWTLGRLRVQGVYIGKDAYRASYLLDPGDCFDEGKHKHSLAKICQELQEAGYPRATVEEQLTWRQDTRRVDVTLIIHAGLRFSVHRAQALLHEGEACDPELKQEVQAEITCMLGRYLEGHTYTRDLLNRVTKKVNAYLMRKGFIDTTIELKEEFSSTAPQVDVLLLATLRTKKKLKFYGHHFFSSDQLREEVLSLRQSVLLIPVSMLADHLLAFYRQHGFWNATIQVQDLVHTVFFFISEGARARITEVELRGATHSPPLRVLQEHFSALLHGHGDVRDVDEGLARLMRWYLSEGFWDCKVLHRQYVPRDDHRKYALLLTLDEGPQRFLERVTVEGYPELEALLPGSERWKQSSGGGGGLVRPFDAALVAEQRRWLTDHFRGQGYLYVTVAHDVRAVGDAYHLVWKIETPADRTRFGRTVLTGKTCVPLEIIQKELCYEEGELWSRKKMERTLEKLRGRGVYDQVHLYPLDMAVPAAVKDVRLHLVDDDPFECKLRLGFQQVSRYFDFHKGTTYKFGASLMYKNPGHKEDVARCDVDITRFYRQIAAQYQKPWIGQLPLQTLYKLYSYKYIQPLYLGSRYPLYEVTQQGGLIGVTSDPGKITGGWNIGCEFMRISDLSPAVARAINFSPRLVDKRLPYVFFEPTFFYDALDNSMAPTRGASVLLSCKGMFPLHAGAFFVRVLVENAAFVPLNNLVVALRLRLGHIFNQEFSEIMPPERFYLGGASSLRGYETDLAPPLGILEQDGSVCYVPQGGKTLMSMNAELRVPVNSRLGLVFFCDWGVLRDTVRPLSLAGGFAGASGFGLRYALPIGPLRFDIGWKWHRRFEGDCPFAWFLTLGEAF